jgi:hypothetical protein
VLTNEVPDGALTITDAVEPVTGPVGLANPEVAVKKTR